MPANSPWPPSASVERQKLLARLAHSYYLDGESKIAIGKQTNLSRFQVAALLQEALDCGIVRIDIAIPVDGQDSQLAGSLGIERIITVGSGSWNADPRDSARETARVIMDETHPGDVLGISWSRVLRTVAQELPPLPHNQVIQLAGALSDDEDYAPRLLAEITCQSAWPLWAPLVVENAQTLMKSPEIAQTLARADSLDVAVISIDAWNPELSPVWKRVPRDIAEVARKLGAVAEISGHLLAADGTLIDSPVESMIVAASLHQIKNARTTVAIAFDAVRAQAVQAAARAGLIDVLVCDESLRRELAAAPGKLEPAASATDP